MRRTPLAQLRIERLDARLLLTTTLLAATSGAGEPDPIVEQVDDVLTIVGSDGDDDIRLTLDVGKYTLEINGEQSTYDATDYDQIFISGGDGRDEVRLYGSPMDDQIMVEETTRMSSFQYVVRVDSAEVVRVHGGSGTDEAEIRDTLGNDRVFMHSSYTTALRSNGDVIKVQGVDKVEAYATRGGYDRLGFYDSADDDRFVGRNDYSYMIGDDFWNYAKGFERVDAYYRVGGADEARLYDSPGDDQFTTQAFQTVLQAGNTRLVTHQYPVTRGYASEGFDTASMRGHNVMTDRFEWRPDSAYVYTTGEFAPDLSEFLRNLLIQSNPAAFTEDGGLKATNVATGFDFVEAFGGNDSDRAELFGSSNADQFFGLQGVAELHTLQSVVKTTDFGVVRAFGEGGSDFAHLEDSEGDDLFVGNSEFAYIDGPEFLNYVEGFAIDAIAAHGGQDRARSLGYGGPDRDFLILESDRYLIFGAGQPPRNERVIGFEAVTADGDQAGLLELGIPEFETNLTGSHDDTQMLAEDQLEWLRQRLDAELIA